MAPGRQASVLGVAQDALLDRKGLLGVGERRDGAREVALGDLVVDGRGTDVVRVLCEERVRRGEGAAVDVRADRGLLEVGAVDGDGDLVLRDRRARSGDPCRQRPCLGEVVVVRLAQPRTSRRRSSGGAPAARPPGPSRTRRRRPRRDVTNRSQCTCTLRQGPARVLPPIGASASPDLAAASWCARGARRRSQPDQSGPSGAPVPSHVGRLLRARQASPQVSRHFYGRDAQDSLSSWAP